MLGNFTGNQYLLPVPQLFYKVTIFKGSGRINAASAKYWLYRKELLLSLFMLSSQAFLI